MSRNRFPGQCYRCGKTVKANEGHFQQEDSRQFKHWPGYRRTGKWLLQHADCAIEHRGTTVHYLYNPTGEKKDA